MPKSVAVIGGGPAGLTTIKELLDEGLNPTGFEARSAIGGVWHPEGEAWNTMTTNLSHWVGHFSSLSFPPNTADFPSKQQMTDYLDAYANEFNLKPHIHCGRKVTLVAQQEDKWLVQWIENAVEHEEIFDAVVLAPGRYGKPYIPSISSQYRFEGIRIHSSQYKSADEYAGKHVVIIGNSASGVSIAEEVGLVAKETYHFFLHGRWILERNVNGIPRDFFKKRAPNDPTKAMDEYYKVSQRALIQNRIPGLANDMNQYHDVTTGDNYLAMVKEGKIMAMKSKIVDYGFNYVEIEDSQEVPADVVIYCTGYQPKFDFLSKELQKLVEGALDLDTFSREVSNFAVMGNYKGYKGNAALPFMELQARLISAVLSGRIKLDAERLQKVLTPSDDLSSFADQIANILGVLPDFDELKKSDPKLYDLVMNGVFVPDHYRLHGTGSMFEKAKEAIIRVNAYHQSLKLSDISQRLRTSSFSSNIITKPNAESNNHQAAPHLRPGFEFPPR